MTPTEKSLTILALWCLFAVTVGPLLARWFDRDRREVGADGAFDTLTEWARESTPIHDDLAERRDWALWELEYLRRGADQ